MKITCMGCQNYEFEIKISDFELENRGHESEIGQQLSDAVQLLAEFEYLAELRAGIQQYSWDGWVVYPSS